jgi:hypothetical protein
VNTNTNTTRQPPIPKPVAQPIRHVGGPLSIDPEAQTGETAPSKVLASGARLASVSTVGTTGYFVQISSQRSEAEVQASFRDLQVKFPRALGDREVIVRRAELGQKGIYYRGMVGPFGSAGNADQFCSDLKAGGGQCTVQKN